MCGTYLVETATGSILTVVTMGWNKLRHYVGHVMHMTDVSLLYMGSVLQFT